MPVRVGPAARALCTLSPRPLQAPLSPPQGPPWASPIDTLSAYLAQQRGSSGCSWKQPIQTPCPRLRAESRWGRASRPPAHLPLLYPCKWGHSCGYCKCGVTNLLWGGCAPWGLLEPGMCVVCSVAGWCSHPHPSPAPQVKARTPGFISVPFSRCIGSRLLLGEGGGVCSGEGEVQGFHSLSAHPPPSRLGLHLADPKPISAGLGGL